MSIEHFYFSEIILKFSSSLKSPKRVNLFKVKSESLMKNIGENVLESTKCTEIHLK